MCVAIVLLIVFYFAQNTISSAATQLYYSDNQHKKESSFTKSYSPTSKKRNTDSVRVDGESASSKTINQVVIILIISLYHQKNFGHLHHLWYFLLGRRA